MIGTYHSLHFIVAEASHREVNYLVRDHAESKTRAKIKNAVHLDPELALLTITYHYILLILDVKRRKIGIPAIE